MTAEFTRRGGLRPYRAYLHSIPAFDLLLRCLPARYLLGSLESS
jgi:hypothetical protein